MTLDADRCYRALKTHDARFDGRFFVGVASTRIYCRPVCTAREPRRENLRFYATAAAAERDGFRPCLRCRPELAPGNAIIDAPRGLAVRAASLIEDGALAEGSGLDGLAARLGVTDRHLRRVFHDEFGVSPIEFSQTQRLLLAKRLLTDTRMSVTDVAMASGFASLRRFNALFKARYRLAPTDLRKRQVGRVGQVGRAGRRSASARGASARRGALAPRHESRATSRDPGTTSNELRGTSDERADAFRFFLRFETPFDWSALLQFLGSRTIEGVEDVDAAGYRRTVRLQHRGTTHTGWIEVAHAVHHEAVELRASASIARVLPQVVGRVKRLFDLACPIRDVESALGELARRQPGLRVPGAFDGFEMAVRAILGQQVTVKAARTLAARFVRVHGEAIETPFAGLDRLFPAPGYVAGLAVPAIASLGIISSRANAIIALARRVADGVVVLEPDVDVDATMERLRAIPGVGAWTAEYIAMRALGWPDAFPEADIGIMKAMGERSRIRLRDRAQAWQPWRSYAVMHLWHSLGNHEEVSRLKAQGSSKSFSGVRPA